MKKSDKKKLEKDIVEDIDKILSYVDSLDNLNIENTNLDDLEKEINSLDDEFKEKYKEYLPKNNLDS